MRREIGWVHGATLPSVVLGYRRNPALPPTLRRLPLRAETPATAPIGQMRLQDATGDRVGLLQGVPWGNGKHGSTGTCDATPM